MGLPNKRPSIFRFGLIFLTLIALVCVLRTFVLLGLHQKKLSPCSRLEGDEYILITDSIWRRLITSLSYKTISHDCGKVESAELQALVKYIIEEHPVIFKSPLVSYEIIAGYSLLIHVRGKSDKLLPYMLAAHLDVVPVIPSQWTVNPFNGTEDAEGTKVYGRGTLDDKGSLMAQLAALEFFLRRGLSPERSLYLAYGHDEEIMGPNGAKNIALALKRRGVDRLHFVLDEGMVVLKNMVPGVQDNIASIGVTEKGHMQVNISIEYTGGHASMPNKETALSILSGAVHRLQSNPMPGRIDELVSELLTNLAPKVKFPANVVLCNLWLFKPVLYWAFSNHKTLQGVVRTTTAVTVFQSGSKSNVISSSAWAIIDHRIHPKDTKEKVIEHIKNVMNDDRIAVEVTHYVAPHPISPYDKTASLAYQVLSDTAEQLFEDAIISPATMIAATDTKHYLSLSNNIYRFNPFILEQKDVATIHAEDEYITKDNFQRAINFFYHLIVNADRAELRNLEDIKEEL